MRLKRVRIFGFKTFADRTEVNLDGGIIAVVGPNGCGKSNLVDAILWALGESNARHLRAAASQDVIFSGSARRKPVGFAEVSLLFDNEDGSLPIDTPEVAVTRRLGRSGDSDYFINHRACRQRDIHELLADSGLGRAGYAIVGQKEIDQALAASAEDRRAWVDEAAGVQRYRLRKVESVKRLVSAREHMVRVADILRELEMQREPLGLEAEVARKYEAATRALREIETGLLIREVTRADREVTELESRLASSAEVARKENERAEALDKESEECRTALEATEHRLEAIRLRLQDALSSIERLASASKLGEERLRSLDELEETLRTGEIDQHVAQAEIELTACQREVQECELALSKVQLEMGGAGEDAKLVAEQLREAESVLAGARLANSMRLKQLAELEHRRETGKLLRRELEGLEKDLPVLSESRDLAGGAMRECQVLVDRLQERLNGLDKELAEIRSLEDLAGVRGRNFMAEQASLEGRKRGIEATIHTHEGLAQGSRAVLEAVERGELTGTYVPVAQAIDTKREYALAIETALAASVNDLIVADESTAKAAIQLLKARRLGRATFQPISLMRSVELSRELLALANRPHVLGRASELVTCDPAHRPVIDSLLGRILIVDHLDWALGMAKTDGWLRIVTLDGEVVHSSGAVSGGVASRQHSGLVQRQADLKAIEKELVRLGRELEILEKASARTETQRQLVLSQVSTTKEELANRLRDFAEAKDYLQTLTSELQAAQKSGEKLGKELDALAVELVLTDPVDIERLQLERDTLVGKMAERSADANLAKERLAEAQERLRQAHARNSGVARRLEAARHSESLRATKLQGLEPERNRIRLDIERNDRERVRTEQLRTGHETELGQVLHRKDALLREGLELSERAKAARANLSAIAEASHQAELARARAEARRATAAERLLEEYGIGIDEAIETEDATVVPADAQQLANRLRKEIRAMGSVNIGAIEAFERVSSRYDELSIQHADILEGIEQVNAGMHELDKLTRERFLETFAKVEVAYGEMFRKLFGGGEGKIFLDNPDSILESGIEIEVTLPGKRRQRLELLSGGERALCATGFLFALLQVRPSPLVVLDEVDAPLDGRNVERFGDLLQEFTDRIQFIVITHNPTTIARAPVWLGITMQEPGVSTVVPARLPQAVVQAPIQESLALNPAPA